MVTMPDFGLESASSILAEIMPIFFYFFFQFFLCVLYVTQVPQYNKHHTSSAGCLLQPSGFNAIHACRPPPEQEVNHACAVWFDRAVLLWLRTLELPSNRTSPSAELGVSAVV